MTELSNVFLEYCNKDIYPIYKLVQQKIIELEESNPDHKSYIGPLVELRNALDHIISASVETSISGMREQLDDAKRHIIRAGQDCYEIFIAENLLRIHEIMKQYSAPVVAAAFSSYSLQIRPKLIEIQNLMVQIRSSKGSDNSFDPKRFELYEENKKHLINIYIQVNGHLNELEKEKRRIEDSDKKLRRQRWKDRFITALILLIIGILGKIIYSWIVSV